MPQHKHYCRACPWDNFRTCAREDCEVYGDWTCPDCELQQQSDYYAACGDQPRLPLDEPNAEPRSALTEVF